ncbi:MAG TPA: hypothetical protein VMV22_09270 [Acidimicrobiales bacterium]|nr:hypothetical protein [Acidimicrobiales bacterium]
MPLTTQTTQTKQRALPLALVGLLGLLAVGAIALSLATAPPVDQQNLRIAAKATMAASGFVLTDTNSVTPLSGRIGAASPRQVVHVLYQAPDRVRESGTGPTGTPVTVIVIGPVAYRSTGSTWSASPPSATFGAQAIATVLSPWAAAAGATTAIKHGDTFDFVPAELDSYITSVLGMPPSQLSSLRLTATVHGDFVTDEKITAVYRGQRLTVDLALSQIGSAPPVVAPRASASVPAR